MGMRLVEISAPSIWDSRELEVSVQGSTVPEA